MQKQEHVPPVIPFFVQRPRCRIRVKFLVCITLLFGVLTSSAWASSVSSPGVVYGRVSDQVTGEPLMAAVLFVEELSRSVHTDWEGLFRFVDLEPGKYRVVVYLSGYKPHVLRNRFESGDSLEMNVSLQPLLPGDRHRCDTCGNPQVVVGRVVDMINAQPLVGAQVQVMGQKLSAISDNEGLFSFLLPDSVNRWHIQTSHARYVDTSQAFSAAPGLRITRCELSMRPLVNPADTCGTILGSVRDASTRAALPLCRVELLNTPFSAQADSSGVFALTNVPKGEYTLVASSRGYESGLTFGVQVTRRDTATLLIELSPRPASDDSAGMAPAISGIVLDEQGNPFDGVHVFLSDGLAQTRSDSLGRFLLENLAPGTVTVCAVAVNADTVCADPLDLWSNVSPVVNLSLIRKLPPAVAPDTAATNASHGVLSGMVVDMVKGVAIPGAVVVIQNSTLRAISDNTGAFRFDNLLPGTYTLEATCAGFGAAIARDIAVYAGQASLIDILVRNSGVTELERMLVRTTAIKNTGASLLKQRQESFTISDAVASDEIAKSGASTAADAVKLITGVSLVDDKYVVIRGLSDRYCNTLLNGIELPSSESDRKAVALDLFPSGLMDNINVVKTFTPNMSGNFSGGVVELSTKAFPEKLELSVGASSGYNSQTTFRDDFLTDQGGKYDWLGFDDGTRAMPEELEGRKPWIPQKSSVHYVSADSVELVKERLDKISKAFKTDFAPHTETARPDQGYSLSMGNTVKVLGNPLGFYLGGTYSNSLRSYRNGLQVKWNIKGHDSTSTSLDSTIYYHEDKSSEKVQWGLLANAGYKIGENHELALTWLQARNVENAVRELVSQYHFNLSSQGETYHRREILYRQRGLSVGVAHGKHQFALPLDPAITWTLGYSATIQEEPDKRTFSDVQSTLPEFTIYNPDGSISEFHEADTSYEIRLSIGTSPEHLFRTITEQSLDAIVELSLLAPDWWTETMPRFSVGASRQKGVRDYFQTKFSLLYGTPSKTIDDVNGSIEAYTADSNIGLVEVPGRDPRLGMVLTRAGGATDTAVNHTALQTIAAGYGMAEIPVLENVRLVGGVRVEKTDMKIESWRKGDTLYEGSLDDLHLLPSCHLILSLPKNMNLRAGYGKTVGRPFFREKAPYSSHDIALQILVGGNPKLRTTTIHNLDLRWEWFTGPGEIVAYSLFYKQMRDPIGVSYSNLTNEKVGPINLKRANAWGMELETKKRFPWLHDPHTLAVGGNVALLKTQRDVDDVKAGELERLITDPVLTQPIPYASPYAVNTFISYDNSKIGLSAAAFFNMFGKYLVFQTSDATPDVYVYPRPDISLTLSKTLFKGVLVKGGVKNLLDAGEFAGHEFYGRDYPQKQHEKGRSFSLGLSWKR